MEKNGFTAEECTFQGVPGYVVRQYIDGVEVAEQFISKVAFQAFFDAIGKKPEIIVAAE